MQCKFLEKNIDYTGEQLKSHWAYKTCDLIGDSLVAFCGRCDVDLSHMVDLEDVKAKSAIFSREMLHFIMECFDRNLELMILRQRMLLDIIKDRIVAHRPDQATAIMLAGDDLYLGEAKVSIAISTLSPISALSHTGINIRSDGTPVKTIGLNDLGISPEPFSQEVLSRFAEEMERVERARYKVKGVP